MAKIERVSSMIEGIPCAVLFNGVARSYKVKCNADGEKYIQIGNIILHEDELPFGEEVTT